MKVHQGVWLPDHETHMVEWMNKSGEIVDGRGTYQVKKWRACIPWIKNWRVAVDVGAHVGFWSIQMAKRFSALHAFEPIAEHRKCFERNVFTAENREQVILWPLALGAAYGQVSFTIPAGSSGGTHVSGPGEIEMRILDSIQLHNVDFLKIDCEGAELAVLEGAVETLERCHPCVIVEQKEHIMAANYGTKGRPAVDFLLGLGAKLRQELSGDYVLTWD